MARVDWIALAVAALSALAGYRRGLVATALSFGGLALGAVIGSRLAPQFLHGGSNSPYTPLAALVGAVVGAMLLQAAASIVGSFARGSLRVIPPLRLLDSIGGLFAGALLGLALVWVAAAVLLQLPGRPKVRDEVLSSKIVQQLNQIVPPRTVLRAFARVDPFPSIAGPTPPLSPPDAAVLRSAAVRRAKASVVRITAVACGLGVEGSGWVAAPHVVVTAAHVVAGARGDPRPRACRQRRSSSTARKTWPSSACRGSNAPALPIAEPKRRGVGRDPRLSRERAIRRPGGPHRQDR